jgi:hypothetical protein
MGYSYCARTNRLCCDACGAADGNTRKRTCPHKVTYAVGGRMGGGSLPYCSPSALCASCYTKHKATLHEGCKAGAARSNAKEQEKAVRFAAGEYERRTAWGSWHAMVPAGMVGVCFVNASRAEEYRLLPEATYADGDWLSQYPDAQPWEVHP